MTLEPKPRSPLAGIRSVPGWLFRYLASKKLSVVLAAFLAAAFGCALCLESTRGREYALWYVYHTNWFFALLGLLGANIVATIASLFPWPLRRCGQIVALAGLLVLLAGFGWSLLWGIDGQLILWPGQTAKSAYIAERSQLVLLSPRGQDTDSVEIGFSPGPADWRGEESLDFGDVDGRTVKVLQFYRHARYEPGWVADESGPGKPAIQVSVVDAQHPEGQTRWHVPILFGNPFATKEPNVSMEQAAVATLRDDFLQTPPLKPGSRGILSVHANGRAYPIPVDGNLGKKIPVGDSGFSVEIAQYHADSTLEKGKFISGGIEPKNPMLELRVYSPGQKEPISEIAYSNQPFVTYEATRKQPCPVKFWYHHPTVTVAHGAQFMQTPDGKLYCRVVADGKYQAKGEVKPGDRIALSASHELTLLQHVPHARPEGSYTPIELAPGETSDAEAAALVELTTSEKSERFWLGRNDALRGVRKLQTAAGPLLVLFGYERRPLGFSVKLAGVRPDADANSPSEDRGISQVQLLTGTEDAGAGTSEDATQEVSAQSPLEFGAFTISQSGVRRLPDKSVLSVLRVTSDPGRLLKYLGGALICGGGLAMLLVRVLVRANRGSKSAAKTNPIPLTSLVCSAP